MKTKVYEFIGLFDGNMSKEEVIAEALERQEGLIRLEGWGELVVEPVNMGAAIDGTNMYVVVFYEQ